MMEGEEDITCEQRELMLKYMQDHPGLATGRITGPDSVLLKLKLLKELADKLNSPNGAIKSPNRWFHVWCRTTKAKAAIIKAAEADVDMHAGVRLEGEIPIEERLLKFLEKSVKDGFEEVADPVDIEELDEDQKIKIPLDLPGPSTAPQLSPPPASLAPSSPRAISPTPSASDQSAQTLPQSLRDIKESNVTKKRRRLSDSSFSDSDNDEGERLVALSERQVELQEQGLQIQRRQIVAIESAADAFCAAMKALENYFKRKSDSAEK